MSFAWLEEGETSQLSDLGKRIASCIRKHGYTEQSWLVEGVRRQFKKHSIARLQITLTRDGDGCWAMAGNGNWRLAPATSHEKVA